MKAVFLVLLAASAWARYPIPGAKAVWWLDGNGASATGNYALTSNGTPAFAQTFCGIDKGQTGVSTSNYFTQATVFPNGASTYTIQMKIRPTALSSGLWGYTNNGALWYITAAGGLQYYDGAVDAGVGAGAIAVNTCYTVRMAANGLKMIIMIDGVERYSRAANFNLPSGSAVVSIGLRKQVNDFVFTGVINDIVVLDYFTTAPFGPTGPEGDEMEWPLSRRPFLAPLWVLLTPAKANAMHPQLLRDLVAGGIKKEREGVERQRFEARVTARTIFTATPTPVPIATATPTPGEALRAR